MTVPRKIRLRGSCVAFLLRWPSSSVFIGFLINFGIGHAVGLLRFVEACEKYWSAIALYDIGLRGTYYIPIIVGYSSAFSSLRKTYMFSPKVGADFIVVIFLFRDCLL